MGKKEILEKLHKKLEETTHILRNQEYKPIPDEKMLELLLEILNEAWNVGGDDGQETVDKIILNFLFQEEISV